jgi:glycerol-3-phosphate dehydrogenase
MSLPNTTCLNLLTRNGSVCLTFHAVLSPAQYEAVYQVALGAWNCEAVARSAKTLAKQWAIAVTIDPC